MITHFISAPKVDNYTNIILYRDNEDPYTFYYLNSTPRVSIDKETKKPAFDYMVIGRDIKREGSQSVQEGRLVLSVNLALTDAEMTAIEKSVKTFVQDPSFNQKLSKDYPNYDVRKSSTISLMSNRTPTMRKLVLQSSGKSVQATIRPIDYTSGTTSINLASSKFDGSFHHETKPALFGECNATFAVNFDGQESQILYEIFKPKEGVTDSVNLSATVDYKMTYKALIPFKATGKYTYQRIYSEIQNLVKSHSGLDSKYYGKYTLPGNCGTYYSNGVNLYVSKEDLQNFLRNSDCAKESISLNISDMAADSKNEDYEQLILTALQNQLSKEVCNKLFEKAEPLSANDVAVTKNDVVTKNSNGAQDSENSNNKPNMIFDACFKLKNDISTSVTSEFEIVINKDNVIEYEANSNGSLVVLLDKYNINSMVRELDASNIYFQEMIVPIKVDNTNFGRDIAMISVRVSYKDKKGNVKLNKVFNFDEENPETKTFRVIMDRDEKSQLIDKFYYQTRIRYRGYDVFGKNVSEDAKWTPVKETQGIGEGIYVPYSDMRNLCVKCEAGDVAWDVVQKMAVEFKYKDAPEKNGATKLMVLTESNPSDTWNCYMYNDTDSYTYRIHYFYHDGTEDWSQEFAGSSKVEKLIVNDKLSGVFRAKFDINFKKSVERIRVMIKCQGKEEDSGWIYQPDTWTWQSRLKEDGAMTYQYKYQYYLVNGDDSMQGTDWSDSIPMNTESSQQTVSIDLRVNQIKLEIDGDSIDWKKWRKVYLHFQYDDEKNNLHYNDEKIPPIKLNESNCETTVVIPVIDESIRPKIYADYIPQDGDDVITSDVVDAKNTFVLLPTHVPPKCEPKSNPIVNLPNDVPPQG